MDYLSETGTEDLTTHFFYSYVLNLGFKRIEGIDDAFFNQNGYGYFYMEKKLNSTTYLEWEPTTHTIDMVRTCKEKIDILGRMTNLNQAEVETFIEFYTKKK